MDGSGVSKWIDWRRQKQKQKQKQRRRRRKKWCWEVGLPARFPCRQHCRCVQAHDIVPTAAEHAQKGCARSVCGYAFWCWNVRYHVGRRGAAKGVGVRNPAGHRASPSDGARREIPRFDWGCGRGRGKVEQGDGWTRRSRCRRHIWCTEVLSWVTVIRRRHAEASGQHRGSREERRNTLAAPGCP